MTQYGQSRQVHEIRDFDLHVHGHRRREVDVDLGRRRLAGRRGASQRWLDHPRRPGRHDCGEPFGAPHRPVSRGAFSFKLMADDNLLAKRPKHASI